MSTFPVFAAAALALLVIPGPAVLYVATRSAAQGRRAGFASVLGVHAGSLVHVLAAVGGLSALLVASAAAFTVVKVVGGAYLVWLGVRTIVDRRTIELGGPVEHRSTRRLFVDGLVVNVLNPKVALFFLAFLPQFVRDGVPVWTQTLVLGLVYVALGVVSDSAYALAGARIGSWMAASAERRRRGRIVEGGILVALGAVTLVTPHRHAD